MEIEVEQESIAEVSAVIASVANLDRPGSAGDGSRERAERDRHDGAETEVEADNGMSRLRSRQRPVPPLPTMGRGDVVDLTEDLDEDMEDVLPSLPDGLVVEEEEDLMDDHPSIEHVPQGSAIRERSVSPADVVLPMNRSTDYLSEGEAEGSGEGGASDGSGRASGEGMVNGKRKR